MNIKTILITYVLLLVFNNVTKAQSKDISFQEIKHNVNIISKSFVEKPEAVYDYLTITLDDTGNRWFYLSWSKLNGLRGSEKDASIKVSVMLLDAVYQNYNYTQNYPISKINFINSLNEKRIIGIKTSTKNNVFFIQWQDLINSNYL